MNKMNIFFIMLLILFSVTGFSWVNGYKYRQKINVILPYQQFNLYDYWVKIPFNTMSLIFNKKLNETCGDIAITKSSGNDEILIPYSNIRILNCNMQNSYIEFKTDLTFGNNTFYIYYGSDNIYQFNTTEQPDLFLDFSTNESNYLQEVKTIDDGSICKVYDSSSQALVTGVNNPDAILNIPSNTLNCKVNGNAWHPTFWLKFSESNKFSEKDDISPFGIISFQLKADYYPDDMYQLYFGSSHPTTNEYKNIYFLSPFRTGQGTQNVYLYVYNGDGNLISKTYIDSYDSGGGWVEEKGTMLNSSKICVMFPNYQTSCVIVPSNSTNLYSDNPSFLFRSYGRGAIDNLMAYRIWEPQQEYISFGSEEFYISNNENKKTGLFNDTMSDLGAGTGNFLTRITPSIIIFVIGFSIVGSIVFLMKKIL